MKADLIMLNYLWGSKAAQWAAQMWLRAIPERGPNTSQCHPQPNFTCPSNDCILPLNHIILLQMTSRVLLNLTWRRTWKGVRQSCHPGVFAKAYYQMHLFISA
jgi:hypothetical protein